MHIESIVLIRNRAVPGEQGVLGTGYLITQDRVLTAAHVVVGVTEVDVVVDQPEARSTVSHAGSLLWTGTETADPGCDIALLKLDDPVSFDVPPALLADVPARSNRPWRSRGFPKITVLQDRVRDSAITVSGSAAEFLADEHYIQLTLDQESRIVKGWKGLSGAPVFENGGSQHLFGVVAEKQPKIDNGLLAISLTRAFAIPSFLEALGSRIARERRNALIAQVKALVGEMKDDTVAQLAHEREDWSRALGEFGDTDALVDCMLGVTDLANLLVAFDNAHAALHSAGLDDPHKISEAHKVVRVIRRLAPVLVDSRVVSVFPGADPGAGLVVELPVGEVPWAELALALFEGRPSRFQVCDEAELRPLHKMPNAVEAGIDPDHKNLLSKYADHLRRRYLPVINDKKFAAMKRAIGEPKAFEKLFKALNQIFDKDAGRSVRGKRRLYFLVEPWTSEHTKAFFRTLQARLPALHLVELGEGDFATEATVSQILYDLLERDEDRVEPQSELAARSATETDDDDGLKEAS